MMSRRVRLAGAVLLLSIVPTTAAFAQYDDDDDDDATTTTRVTQATTTTTPRPTTTSTVAGATTTTQPSTTTTDAPPPNLVSGETSNATPAPGEPIQVSSPAVRDVPVFAADQPISAGMTRTNPDGSTETVDLQPTFTTDPDGTVRVTVQIPMGTPTDRIYTVFVVGTNPDGLPRTLVVDVVVRQPGRAAAGAEFLAAQKALETFQTQVASSTVAVPASVRAIEPLTADEEADYVAAVLEEGADIRIEGTKLVLHRPGTDDDQARPYVAAAAVAVAGGALVSIRRRPATAKNGS